jgi:hypothetical protein
MHGETDWCAHVSSHSGLVRVLIMLRHVVPGMTLSREWLTQSSGRTWRPAAFSAHVSGSGYLSNLEERSITLFMMGSLVEMVR